MGQPGILNRMSSRAEFIGALKPTQGSETSQYLLEKKSIEIPPVAASERGTAQTDPGNRFGVVGLLQGLPGKLSRFTIVEGLWKGPPKRVTVP
jgi:hypothetical protein